MCGIFGYAGTEASPEVLVEGIKRLEYRGYDSWGICVACSDSLTLLRRVGRIGAVPTEHRDSRGRALPGRHRAHPLGHARRPHRGQRASPHRLLGQDRGHPQRHHREPRGPPGAPRGPGPRLPQRDGHGGHPPPHRGVPQDSDAATAGLPDFQSAFQSAAATPGGSLRNRRGLGGRPGRDLRGPAGKPDRAGAGQGPHASWRAILPRWSPTRARRSTWTTGRWRFCAPTASRREPSRERR